MARIRSLKPDLWMSPQVMNLAHDARLLFVGLITQADDEGRGTADLRRLKASIFGGDDLTAEDVRRMLDECVAQSLVDVYPSENHGNVYALPSWKTHQSIDRPRKSLYPEPPPRRTLVEPRTIIREGLEGNGMEGKGMDGRIRARETGSNPGGDMAPTTGGGSLAYSTGLTELPADDTSKPAMAWLEVGCDVQAMTQWLDHLEALAPPKRLAPHARIHAAKLLAGMGDAAAQRRAVSTAAANGWRNLRHTDGASTERPGARKTMAERLAALGPDDSDELEDTGATA